MNRFFTMMFFVTFTFKEKYAFGWCGVFHISESNFSGSIKFV